MIAISYRREDSLPIAGRLYDRLQSEFGKGNVFMDFDSIPYGVDFREHIKQMLDGSKVLLALIGPAWVGKGKQRTRRIDDPADFIRLEIAYAFERKIPVIPVLINDTRMPSAKDLPPEIQDLAFRNAITLDVGIDFHPHANRLIVGINRLIIESARSAAREERKRDTQAQVQTTSAPAPPPAKIAPPKQSTPIPEIPSSLFQGPQLLQDSKSTTRKTPTELSQKPSPLERSTRSPEVSRAPFSKLNFRVVLRGQKQIVIAGAICLLMTAAATATWYFGFHRPEEINRKGEQNSFRVQKLAETLAAATKSIAPGPLPAGSQISRAPTAAPSVVAAQARGTLRIDSSPPGQSYEAVDADGSYRSGITPALLKDFPAGYAQVIFKREGFSDHSEAAWIAPKTESTVTWNYPEQWRIQSTSASTQSPVIASTAITPLSRNNRTWQAWIGEFVRQFISANQLQDVDANLEFYSATVDYFDDGLKDHAYIRPDIEKYKKRWPLGRDSIEGDIELKEKIPGIEYAANYKLNYYAESTERGEWSQGQGAIDLDISVIDGVPRISGIKHKALRRRKGKIAPGGPSLSAGSEQQVDGNPRVVYAPRPTYPDEANRTGAKGSGRFSITFDELGNAKSVEVIESTGDRLLDANTTITLKRWRAAPGNGGKTVVPITYTKPKTQPSPKAQRR
jgi:TonB family protein